MFRLFELTSAWSHLIWITSRIHNKCIFFRFCCYPTIQCRHAYFRRSAVVLKEVCGHLSVCRVIQGLGTDDSDTQLRCSHDVPGTHWRWHTYVGAGTTARPRTRTVRPRPSSQLHWRVRVLSDGHLRTVSSFTAAVLSDANYNHYCSNMVKIIFYLNTFDDLSFIVKLSCDINYFVSLLKNLNCIKVINMIFSNWL